jgi:branched-chain amino acid transport system substrate-binding protein
MKKTNFMIKNIKNKKILWIILILLILIFTTLKITGNLTLKEDEKYYKIGAILHLTGDQANIANAFLEGIIIAVDEINYNGGINNKKIKLIVEDSQLTPSQAYNSAVKLVEIENVKAIILASYLEGMATGSYLEKKQVPSIVLWDSAKDLENIGEYLFAMGVWTPSSGEKAANFSYNNLNFKKMAIINNNNEWSISVSDYFENKFKELGGEIIFTDTINPKDSIDYRTTILKLRNKDVDGIYTPITDGVINFYKQYYESGLNLQIITSDIISNEDIIENEIFFQDIYQTLPLNPISEDANKFNQKYFERYNQYPTQILYNALGYDSVYLIKEALRYNSIKEGLYNLRYHGISGVIDFDENGSSKTLEKVFIIESNQFKLIE